MNKARWLAAILLIVLSPVFIVAWSFNHALKMFGFYEDPR